MKNFTLLLSAVMLMGISASAAGLAQKSLKAQDRAKHVWVENTQKATNFDFRTSPRAIDPSKSFSQRPVLSRAEEDIIFEPEGEAKPYVCNSLNWINNGSTIYLDEMGGVTDLVWGEDGEVYIKNIVDLGMDTYVKGTYADGVIRVDFPQSVYFESGEDKHGPYTTDYYINICKLVVEEDSNSKVSIDYVEVDQEDNYAIYTVDEDGVINLELSDWEYNDEMFEDYTFLPDLIIGMMLDDTTYGKLWMGFATIKQRFIPLDGEVVTPPEDVDVEKWVMEYNDIDDEPEAMFVNVAIDGKHMYLGGFDEYVDGWAKGIIMGDTVIFEGDQFLGYMDLYNIFLYFRTAIITEEEFEDEYGEVWIDPVANFTDGIVFKYDKENKRLETVGETTIVINAGKGDFDLYDMYKEPQIYMQTDEMVNAAPLTPEMIYFIPWGEAYFENMGEMWWDIPNVNVNGALLDTERMYYNIYFDGEQYPLDPDEYQFVEEILWDIPYDYTDGDCIVAFGSEHNIWFYADGVKSFGCQSFFVGTDGEIYASEMGIYIPGETGIDGVKEFIKVESTTYFDLSGRQVANPQTGLYIKSMKLADGKVSNVKVFIK